MSRLRVAIDATPLYGPRTGVGRFTEELLGHLATDDDLDLVAFAVTFRGRERLADLVPAGITVTTRPMAAAPLRAAWRRFDAPPLERWTGPIDVVHGTNYVVPPARARRVATVHDLTFVHFPEMCTADVLQYRGLLRRALDRGAWVHTVSEFVRNEVIELLGAEPERVVAIPNGVTPVAGGDARRGRALARGERYVMALGTIEPRKDLPTLVAAFDDLAGADPDLRLVVAGPDGWGIEQYTAAAAQARHADRITRIGFVDEAARADLLAGASALAMPSVYEGFGLPAAEAMLAGVPVVAAAAGALPEVVGDAGLLVPPRDVDALASALARVLDDGALARELAQRGPERSARYTWAATAHAIAALWHRVATR